MNVQEWIDRLGDAYANANTLTISSDDCKEIADFLKGG